ncbi:hypothetical protein KCU91_g12, partial [Aureobasidium melanogenum]
MQHIYLALSTKPSISKPSALSEQRVSRKTEKLELRLRSAMDSMSSSKGLTKASRFLAVISNSNCPLLAVAYPSPSPGDWMFVAVNVLD